MKKATGKKQQPARIVSQALAENESNCSVAEQVRNGEPINWPYWLGRKSITPAQAAKLAHCIDPIKWPDEVHKQGLFRPELRERIQRLTEWLADKNPKWTLASLVEVLGGYAPFTMREAVTGNDGEEKSLPTANWILLAQAEAAKRWISLRNSGAFPNKNNISDDLVKWCAEKKIKTKTGIPVTKENLDRFALRPWTPPVDSESSESSETET